MRVRASIGPLTLERQEDAQALLLALYALNLHYLRTRPAGTWPPLLESRVRYKREPKGRVEHWQTLPELFASRFGDCEDLSCALAAQETIAGRPSVPHIKAIREGLFHVVVAHEGGTETDPSALLGMLEDAPASSPARGRELREVTKRVAQNLSRAATAATRATGTGTTATQLSNIAKRYGRDSR